MEPTTTEPEILVHPVTDASFSEDVEQFKGVVLIDFWATWCPPCKAMAPVIEEIAEQYKENPLVKIVSIDIDANPGVTEKYRILSIPNFRFFINGAHDSKDKAQNVVGVSPITEFTGRLDAALATFTPTA